MRMDFFCVVIDEIYAIKVVSEYVDIVWSGVRVCRASQMAYIPAFLGYFEIWVIFQQSSYCLGNC